MRVYYFLAPLQTVTQLGCWLAGPCWETHPVANAGVQLPFWFIDILCWPVLSHQLCGRKPDWYFFSYLSSRRQTFVFASSVATGSHLCSKSCINYPHYYAHKSTVSSVVEDCSSSTLQDYDFVQSTKYLYFQYNNLIIMIFYISPAASAHSTNCHSFFVFVFFLSLLFSNVLPIEELNSFIQSIIKK